MKKCLMIICSKAQLLQGFHIRQSMLKECYVDIVLFGEVQFDKGYVERLQKFYNHAWFVENNYCTQKEYIKYYLSPRKALKNLIDEKFEPDYTDVFCWDPGWCWYWLVRNERKERLKYKWHLIQDANGNYFISSIAFNHQHNPRNIVEKVIDYIESKVLNLFPMVYDDEYIWKPYLRIVSYNHNIVEVPSINANDVEMVASLNYIFDYNPEKDEVTRDKYLFIDTVPESFYEYTCRIIIELYKITGEKISLFIHPRANPKEYEDLSEYVNLMECRVPWEIYYLNRMTNNRVILGVYTSALNMGWITSDDETDIYSFVSVIDVCDFQEDYTIPLCLPFYEKVASYDDHFHILNKIEELSFF